MSTTFTKSIIETFWVISCYSCGVRFAIGSDLYRRVVTDAQDSVFCPACGSKSCWRESEAQKKIKELERKLQWEANESARQKMAREAAESSLNATKGVVTRLKRRTACGVCPCCKRTFSQLARHIAHKHPDFKASVT